MTPDAAAAANFDLQRGSSLARARNNVFRFVRNEPLSAAAGVVVVLLIALAFLGPFLAPERYDNIDIRARFQGPSWSHFFGTDDKGRDVFSRVIYGARTTVIVGFGATIIATLLASAIGIVSGYFGGLFDTIAQRILEIWQAFPGLIFVIFIVSVIGSNTLNVVGTIGLLFAAGTSRVIRSAALAIRQQSYIEAASASGAGHLRILVAHILPNVFPVIIITASVQIGAVILVESSLAFIGFGVPPPFPSWGLMLQDAQRFMQTYPHLAFFPGAAIALVVYSFNMLGDGVRDILDPRLRGSR